MRERRGRPESTIVTFSGRQLIRRGSRRRDGMARKGLVGGRRGARGLGMVGMVGKHDTPMYAYEERARWGGF